MYYQLERSAGLSLEAPAKQAPAAEAPPPAPPSAPLPAAAPPLPPAPAEETAASASPATAAPPPPAVPLPPPPTAPLPPPPAPAAAKETAASDSPAATVPPPPPAAPSPPPPTAPLPPPPAPAAAKADGERTAGSNPIKKGFGWLKRGQKAKAEPLAKLLQSADAEGHGKFLRAVASELCVDSPEGCFKDVAGLTAVPASVPKSARTALLHAAVKAEAEGLTPVDRAKQIVRVGKSMVMELVDRAASLEDKEECIAALDNLVGFASDAQHLCEELAPDVEFGPVTYEGTLRYNKLEELYSRYLDTSMQEVQQQTSQMLGSLMGGNPDALNFDSMPGMEQMQARIDQGDRNRSTLAGIFKIAEGKAEKLMQKKMTSFAEEAQKEMFAGLKDFAM